MKESRTVEYKERMTDTFLKTVSAYANYGTGQILFGIADDGKEIGIENPDDFCLAIENKINDNISPKPDFTLSVNRRTNVISLSVFEGEYKPYTFRGKAYKRNDTSTVEVDRLSYNRLVLEGSGRNFEELPSKNQNLQFAVLTRFFSEKLDIPHIDSDILKTLELCSVKNEFNNAAALIADENNFSGIDIVRFGETIDEIMDRHTIEKQSVLSQYEKATEIFRTYYQMEKISGIERTNVELVPEKAFREAVANALVHRLWDINAHIKVEMYSDRISVTSPGGLPTGISEAEYLEGHISLFRNPILGSLFFRLRLIEKFGTGIRRIKSAYKDSSSKPEFLIGDNTIQVILPVLNAKEDVEPAEQEIISALSNNMILSSSEIAAATGFSRDKVIRLASSLIRKGLIQTTGNGRGTKYRIRK